LGTIGEAVTVADGVSVAPGVRVVPGGGKMTDGGGNRLGGGLAVADGTGVGEEETVGGEDEAVWPETITPDRDKATRDNKIKGRISFLEPKINLLNLLPPYRSSKTIK
jgi:hypothetical protein